MRSVGSFKLFILMILSLVCFTFQSFAEADCWDKELETVFVEYKVVGNKIYIQPDQLHFTTQSIYIYVQGEQVSIQQLSCDATAVGVFIFPPIFEELKKIDEYVFGIIRELEDVSIKDKEVIDIESSIEQLNI